MCLVILRPAHGVHSFLHSLKRRFPSISFPVITVRRRIRWYVRTAVALVARSIDVVRVVIVVRVREMDAILATHIIAVVVGNMVAIIIIIVVVVVVVRVVVVRVVVVRDEIKCTVAS